MDIGKLPPIDLRPRPHHALVLVDLALIAGIFMFAGNTYTQSRGDEQTRNSERLREIAQQRGSRLLSQADSVVVARRQVLAQSISDSTQMAEELVLRRAQLEAAIAEHEHMNQSLFPLSDQILDLRQRGIQSIARADGYERDVADRKAELAVAKAKADSTLTVLEDARRQRDEAVQDLAAAQTTRAYEPVGLFPDRSGLTVRQEANGETDLTNLELQHNVWRPGNVDVGVSLGVGLGGGDASSSKQVGLVLTRNLIHRRLGVDVGAGYSLLTDQAGTTDGSPYASASLKLSPFYRQRVHFGLGARAVSGEFLPFVAIGVGRR